MRDHILPILGGDRLGDRGGARGFVRRNRSVFLGQLVALPVTQAPDGTIYMLFVKGIAKVDPATYAIDLIAQSPVPIGPGGDILDGRIYFASGSHMYSYEVPKE